MLQKNIYVTTMTVAKKYQVPCICTTMHSLHYSCTTVHHVRTITVRMQVQSALFMYHIYTTRHNLQHLSFISEPQTQYMHQICITSAPHKIKVLPYQHHIRSRYHNICTTQDQGTTIFAPHQMKVPPRLHHTR